MRNRDRYITGRNEYDLMMRIKQNIGHGTHCPIKAISGEYDHNTCLQNSYQCDKCVQAWLNKEEK